MARDRHSDQGELDDSFRRFLQEYEIVQRIRSPGVVRLYDLGVSDEHAWLVMEYFAAGESYPVGDFVARSREALNIGSERVREKYGFACSAALDQLARIEEDAGRFSEAHDARVTVLALD